MSQRESDVVIGRSHGRVYKDALWSRTFLPHSYTCLYNEHFLKQTIDFSYSISFISLAFYLTARSYCSEIPQLKVEVREDPKVSLGD